MGDPVWNGTTVPPAVVQTAFEYTSTRSIFTQTVNGTVGLTVTFLSNLTPDDFQRLSLPFSYMEVDVYSLDGQDHDVQLYTDISAGKREVPSTLSVTLADHAQNGSPVIAVLLPNGTMESLPMLQQRQTIRLLAQPQLLAVQLLLLPRATNTTNITLTELA